MQRVVGPAGSAGNYKKVQKCAVRCRGCRVLAKQRFGEVESGEFHPPVPHLDPLDPLVRLHSVLWRRRQEEGETVPTSNYIRLDGAVQQTNMQTFIF